MNPISNNDPHLTHGTVANGEQRQPPRGYGVGIPNGYHIAASASPIQRARHPQYEDSNERILSFATWRWSHVQDPTMLANYGFFYTGEKDLVRCFYCSIGLKEFIKSDNVLQEHIRHSGDCNFLVQLLGPRRLQELKVSLAESHATTGIFRELSELNENLPEINETRPNNSNNEFPQGYDQYACDLNQNGFRQTKPSAEPKHRHPEYSQYAVRLSSFVGWPSHLVQTPEKLAKAGLYFTGTRDIVRCYSCDGGLEKWDPNDDPLIEHCINFPDCRYLRETKGEAYIALARSRREQLGASLTNGAVDQAIGNLRIQDNKNGSPIESDLERLVIAIVDMGYPRDDVQRAIDALKKDHTMVTTENIIDELERLQKTGTLTQNEVLKEHKQLKAKLFCMQCETEEINVLFLPCQHHRFCTSCSSSLSQCPLCGQNIVQSIKTYRP